MKLTLKKPDGHYKTGVIILLHSCIWILFFLLPLLLHPPFENRLFSKSGIIIGEIRLRNLRFNLYHTICDLLLIGIFYLNAYALLPGFLKKRKKGKFILSQILIFAGFVLVTTLLFKLFVGAAPRIPVNPLYEGRTGLYPGTDFIHQRTRTPLFIIYTRHVLPYVLILLASIAYRLIIDRLKTDRLAKEKENENLKTELQLLRSQISPHFMFNVLNNMVSLARKQSDQLETSLIKLSSLMRYMLFEVREDKVPLSKEIEYLQSYIDLQEQRFRGTVTVKTDLVNDYKDYVIEPMLLIPFVENAFKHGTGLIEHAEIDIRLKIVNEVLCFFVSNKYEYDRQETKDKTSGIGLANVRKRLNLLYGNLHQLDIIKKEHWHTISLRLNLN